MGKLANISSPKRKRRLPASSWGVDVNFCRNPQCDLFAVPPDPLDNRGNPSGKVKPNQPHGTISGSGDSKSFVCGSCRRASILKNNRAVVQEYRRLRGRFRPEPPRDVCPDHTCENHRLPLSAHPERYRKSGRTAKGAQRWKCKACLASFSLGSRIRRQKRSSANRDVLWMLTNGLPISKICDFTGLSPRDVYGKIDFIHDRVVDINARREGCFERVDWERVGRRFATDSQTLLLNWPNKKTRAQIAVHHLCTAHANSGYIMAAHLGLDPETALEEVEVSMAAAGDFALPRAFRRQARVWSETEFADYLARITRSVAIHPLDAPEVNLGLQLPHVGAMLRQDVMQLAHAFLLRRFLGKGDERFVFVLDADPGLALSFVTAFAPWVKSHRADVSIVRFDKHQSNDQRNMLVTEGKARLAAETGISSGAWAKLSAQQAYQEIDVAIERLLEDGQVGEPFDWPFHTKSEPQRQIRLITDRASMDPARRARLMRLSTLRSVDSYFHKVRSNLRFAARPGRTPSSNDRAWDRHYLYNPRTMSKIVEIYRFAHNWMGTSSAKKAPAVRLGLARGPMRAAEFFE